MRSREIEEYKKGLALSSLQREVLIGLLLGDAHLETRNSGRTYRLKIEQCVRHEAYVAHLFGLFREWVLTAPQRKKARNGTHGSENIWFQTVSHAAFRFYARQFYHAGKKIVPELIHRWLSPVSLAYWFMDDGRIKSKQSKGVLISTHAFTQREVDLLCTALRENFGLEAAPRSQSDGIQIYISGRSYERFVEIVEPFIISEMLYKLPNERTKHRCPKSNGGAQW